jgi:hypothetical protein
VIYVAAGSYLSVRIMYSIGKIPMLVVEPIHKQQYLGSLLYRI